LSTHHDRIEFAPDRGAGGRVGNTAPGSGRKAFVDHAMQVIEQEADVIVWNQFSPAA
jgi:hypothetical protein